MSRAVFEADLVFGASTAHQKRMCVSTQKSESRFGQGWFNALTAGWLAVLAVWACLGCLFGWSDGKGPLKHRTKDEGRRWMDGPYFAAPRTEIDGLAGPLHNT